MRVLIVMLVMVSVARAEKLELRGSQGEMVASPTPCGKFTRKQVESYIAARPLIVIGNADISMGPKGGTLKPATMYQEATSKDPAFGFWRLDSKMDDSVDEPPFMKTIIVALTPRSRKVRLSIVRKIDDIECYEQWEGLATEVRP